MIEMRLLWRENSAILAAWLQRLTVKKPLQYGLLGHPAAQPAYFPSSGEVTGSRLAIISDRLMRRLKRKQPLRLFWLTIAG